MAIDDSADYLGQVDQYGEAFQSGASERVKITGYYPASVDIDAIAAQANERLAEWMALAWRQEYSTDSARRLAEEDWARITGRSTFEPARII